MVPSQPCRPLDLLGSELECFVFGRLVRERTRVSILGYNLGFRSGFGNVDIAVVNLFDDVVCGSGDELSGGVVEAVTLGPREHRFIRNLLKAECVAQFGMPGEIAIALACELPVEK